MYDEHTSIKVEAKVIGKRRPATSPWYVPLPTLSPEAPGTEQPLQLRDLITYIVREEVRAFRLRQDERRLLRVLSSQEIIDAAGQGKIAMGGVDGSSLGQPNAEVDEDSAIQVALQGFADGLYLVFLDGEQQRDLAATVQPQPASTLLFLRLVALAGG